jgi:hypothetical protein
VAGEDYTGIYLLPPTGGPERKLISRGNVSAWGNEISWSADGRYLAFLDQAENPRSSSAVRLFLLRLDDLHRTPAKNRL